MPKPPPKHKPRDDWSAEDHFKHLRTGAEPITDAWKDYIRDTAEAAGVEPADLGLDDEQDRPLEDMSVADHVNRLQRERGNL